MIIKNNFKNKIILTIILFLFIIFSIYYFRNWKIKDEVLHKLPISGKYQIRENMEAYTSLESFASSRDPLNHHDKINKYSKDDLCLDLDEKANKLIMQTCSNKDSQNWIPTLISSDTNLYNLHNQKLNKKHNPKCLDIVNDGKNNKLIMNKCGNYSGQQWTIPDGIQSNFRNIFSGKDKCLNIEKDDTLLMTPCKNTEKLTWQITQLQ